MESWKNVNGATIADGVATGTIVSDDQATVSSPVSAAASGNTLRWVLTLVGSTGTESDACRCAAVEQLIR